MKRLLSVFVLSLFAMGTAVKAGPVLAADTDADDEGVSAYSVARLKIFEGTAWVRSPDSGEWEESTTNTPITEKSRVNIPEGSEAELQFHGGQYVLLRGGSEVDLRKMDEGNSVFGLRSGEIRFDLPADDFSPVRIALSGGGKVNLAVPGRYWLTVQDGGGTRLVVRSGEGTVSAPKGEYSVKAGQEASIGQDVRIAAYQGKADDSFSTPPPLTGEERQADVPPATAYELRDYGEWVYSDNYGWVWQPRVAADWSPYYYGRWAWISPYGWTWVSYEPWGWYPYHFGWWFPDPFFGWVWCPFRSFVSVSFFFGNFHFAHFHRHAFFFPANARFIRDGRFVRWAPLRPGERFVRPAFTRSDARLARFDRPLARGSVFSRTQVGGKREWREWTSTRGDRRTVTVREGVQRPVDRGARQPALRAEERAAPRTQMDRGGPSDRQDRMPRFQDRQERMQQREFRGGGGRGSGVGDNIRQERRRQDASRPVRTERVNVPRPNWETRGQGMRESRPARPIERARPFVSPARNPVPGRGFSRPEAASPPARTWSGGDGRGLRSSGGDRSSVSGNRGFGGNRGFEGGDGSFGGGNRSFGGGDRGFGGGVFRGGGFGGFRR